MYSGMGILVGHLLGDFIFQNDWMARNKAKEDEIGLIACLVHCIIYALCVSTCVLLDGWYMHMYTTPVVNWALAFIIAFVTHFPIDRYGVASKWMNLFGQSRDVKVNPFVPCVHIGVDNGAHLLLMWLLYSWMGVGA